MDKSKKGDVRVAFETANMKRSSMLGALAVAGAAAGARPALAADACLVGPPAHVEGPRVYANYDQVELDAAYDQNVYAPLQAQIQARRSANSKLVLARLGDPLTVSYGPTEVERLDIHRAKRRGAPVFVFIHGGAWRAGTAREYAVYAEPFVTAGATLVLPDFPPVTKVGGNLNVMADCVRRAIAWAYINATSYGGDPKRFFVGGHSSGGHLCGVAVTSDWSSFHVPPDFIKGAVLMSGMYDLVPVSLSSRREYVTFDPATIDTLSSQRHIDRLRTPITVTYGTSETPEFQRQNREFAAAVKAAGKPVQLIEAASYNHFEMEESLGNPYGPNGRASLALVAG
jgi:arylformamidase